METIQVIKALVARKLGRRILFPLLFGSCLACSSDEHPSALVGRWTSELESPTSVVYDEIAFYPDGRGERRSWMQVRGRPRREKPEPFVFQWKADRGAFYMRRESQDDWTPTEYSELHSDRMLLPDPGTPGGFIVRYRTPLEPSAGSAP